MFHFNVLFRHSPGKTEDNHETKHLNPPGLPYLTPTCCAVYVRVYDSYSTHLVYSSRDESVRSMSVRIKWQGDQMGGRGSR
jgi:hypothetical protein